MVNIDFSEASESTLRRMTTKCESLIRENRACIEDFEVYVYAQQELLKRMTLPKGLKMTKPRGSA